MRALSDSDSSLKQLLTARIDLPQSSYRDDEKVVAFDCAP